MVISDQNSFPFFSQFFANLPWCYDFFLNQLLCSIKLKLSLLHTHPSAKLLWTPLLNLATDFPVIRWEILQFFWKIMQNLE